MQLTTLPHILLLLATTTAALPLFHTNLPNSYPDRVEDLIPRTYTPPITPPTSPFSSSRSIAPSPWQVRTILTAAIRSLSLGMAAPDDSNAVVAGGVYDEYTGSAGKGVGKGEAKGYKEEGEEELEVRRAMLVVQRETERRVREELRW